MKRRLLTIVGILAGLAVTGMLVAASIWPVINVVETGKTPEYPEVQPQYYTAEPQRVFEESRSSIEAMERWEVVSSQPANHVVKATHSTYVFGFVDDVTVWIEPVTEFVTRVRVRSASRIGKGDFGQNARNIQQFFGALDERLGAVKFDPEQLDAPSDQPDADPPEADAGD
jgi:uncharacterized protein (DUF1499 family)